MDEMKKIVAIFGGAFNPITRGHIQTVESILYHYDKYDLNELWISPTYCHTFNKNMVSPKHRLAMCKLAKPKNDRIKIFDYEIKNKLKNGTLDFYNQLINEKKYKNFHFFFVIGTDNVNSMENWVNYKQLLKTVHFIVVERPGVVVDPKHTWYKNYPHLYFKDANIIETSSTQVRTLFSEYYKTKDFNILKELRNHIEIPVLNYILKNKLYANI